MNKNEIGADYNFGLTIPSGWDANKEIGIVHVKKDGTRTQICKNMVLITRFLVNNDNNLLVEVKFFNKYWRSLIISPSKIFDSRYVKKINGLDIQIENGKNGMFVQYLDDFRDINDIPRWKSVSQMGWIVDEEEGDYNESSIRQKNIFFPYCDNIEFITTEASYRGLYKALIPNGTFDEWKKEAGKYWHGSIRLMMAASFASPLISLIHHRIIIVYLNEVSKSGKTSALNICMSIWGHPASLMNNSLKKSKIESKCAALNNLPFCIDEPQNLEKNSIKNYIIYTLTEGRGTLKCNSKGNLLETKTWKNIILAAGKEPLLYGNASLRWSRARMVEIKGKPFNNIKTAQYAEEFFNEQYGTAGPIFIDGLVSRLQEKNLKDDYDVFYNSLKEQRQENEQDNNHFEHVALLCLGDFYASMFIWNQSEKESLKDAINIGMDLLKKKL